MVEDLDTKDWREVLCGIVMEMAEVGMDTIPESGNPNGQYFGLQKKNGFYVPEPSDKVRSLSRFSITAMDCEVFFKEMQPKI